MDSLSSIQPNPCDKWICEPQDENPFLECSEPFGNQNFQEYQRLTKTNPHPTNATKFKGPEPKTNGDDVALGGIVLGLGWLAGGPIGFGVGALLLAGCYPVEEVGVAEQGVGSAETFESTDMTSITNEAYFLSEPSLAWTGSEYGMSWSGWGTKNSGLQIFFSKIDSQGSKIGNAVQISNGVNPLNPYLIWNQSANEYVVCWDDTLSDKGKIFLGRISENGNRINDEISLVDEPYSKTPAVVWNASDEEYGISWIGTLSGEGNHGIEFGRFDLGGNQRGNTVILSSALVKKSSIVWNGREYAVSWAELGGNGGIKFSRISRRGVIMSEAPTSIDYHGYNSSDETSLASAENNFGISWFVQGDSDGVYFLKLSSEGQPMGKAYVTIYSVISNCV